MLLILLEVRELTAVAEAGRVVMEKLVLVDSRPSPVTSAHKFSLVLRAVPASTMKLKDGLKV